MVLPVDEFFSTTHDGVPGAVDVAVCPPVTRYSASMLPGAPPSLPPSLWNPPPRAPLALSAVGDSQPHSITNSRLSTRANFDLLPPFSPRSVSISHRPCLSPSPSLQQSLSRLCPPATRECNAGASRSVVIPLPHPRPTHYTVVCCVVTLGLTAPGFPTSFPSPQTTPPPFVRPVGPL